MLIAARGLHGIGATPGAPNALALIATTFPVGNPEGVNQAGEALAHDFVAAFLAGAGMLWVAAVMIVATINTRRIQPAAIAVSGV